METFYSYLTNSYMWLLVSGIYVFVHVLYSRKSSKASLPFINISAVIKNYRKVFIRKQDFYFFIFFPFLLSVATHLSRSLNSEISNIICVVLSILESAVLTFMAMTNDEAAQISRSSNLYLNHLRQIERIKDTIAVGMYDVVIGIIVLIMNFLFPITKTDKWFSRVVSLLVYWGFYIFVFNIFIMVRKLTQINQYFPPHKK